MRILLVEDEKLLSGYIAKGLQNSGYAVDAVYDGEEALYEYSINEYDLIVLDLNLPKKDGIEVLQEIREQDANIKIMILSAGVRSMIVFSDWMKEPTTISSSLLTSASWRPAFAACCAGTSPRSHRF